MKANYTSPFFVYPLKLFIKLIWKFNVIVLLAFLFSCVNPRKETDCNDIGSKRFLDILENLETVLQKIDILSISVSGLNHEVAEIFNTPNLTDTHTSSTSGTTTQASDYLIDQEDFIRFPILRKLKAAGKTIRELQEGITQQLIVQKLLLEPMSDVRHLNYKMPVLSEVRNPSVWTIHIEKVSSLKAVGLVRGI